MDRILIILKKENRSRASSALTLGLNTIILKHVYWYTYMQQISGERLQDHWSSGSGYHEISRDARKPVFGISDQVRHKPGCTVSEAG